MMLTSMWFMSIVTLLVVDVRIRALPQKDGVPHRCHHCTSNATECTGAAISVIECTGDHVCATSAVSPNFTSELTCAAAANHPCSLTLTADTYTLVCTCAGDLCNAPFSIDTQKHLLNYTTNYTKDNSSDHTKTFFAFANITQEKMYKTMTVETAPAKEKVVQNLSHPTTIGVAVSTHTTISHSEGEILPRAEAFKHEPTALSEDDEDASEGSGSYEETRTQRQPASDPADPSSFLPANENKAHTLAGTFLIAMPVIMYFIA